ncbi:IS66 family transposase, partial [Methylobacterium sp. WL12]
MALDPGSLPDDVDALKRMIVGMAREAVHANTLIEKLRSELARLKRAQFGVSSEKLKARVEQLELAIEALEVDEAERLAAAPVVADAVEASRVRPARRPLPDHLARESVIHPGPCACPSCGGVLRRIGEDVTETLDYVPGRFKVVR